MRFRNRLRELFHWKKKKVEEDKPPVYEFVDSVQENIYHGPDDNYEEIENLDSVNIPVRRIEACQLNENQGKMKVIVTVRQQSQVLTEDRSICQALALTDIRDLIVGGRLSNKGCSILTNVVRCDSLKIENAVVSCNYDWLCQLLQRTKEVEFVNCTFEDAQTICDDLFIHNVQILRLKILHNSRKYSFPLLTDNLLRFWQQQRQDLNIQLRAETSFTVTGIQYLCQVLLQTQLRNSSIYLGKIVSCPLPCRDLPMPEGLRVESKGRRFFVKDSEERIFVSFDTTETREDPVFSTEIDKNDVFL